MFFCHLELAVNTVRVYPESLYNRTTLISLNSCGHTKAFAADFPCLR